MLILVSSYAASRRPGWRRWAEEDSQRSLRSCVRTCTAFPAAMSRARTASLPHTACAGKQESIACLRSLLPEIRTLHYAHRQVLQPSWPVSGRPKPGRVILAQAPHPSTPPQSMTPGSCPDALAPTSGRPPLSCLPPQGAGSQLLASWFAPTLKYPRDFSFPTAHSGRSPNTRQSPPRSGLLNAQRGRSVRLRGACFPCGETEDKQENAKSWRWAPAGRRQRARSGGPRSAVWSH